MGRGTKGAVAALTAAAAAGWMATLAALAVVGGGAGGQRAAVAQQRDFSKVEIKVTPVAGKVYMLEGAGGNIGASVGEDGILLVDDQFEPLAPRIRAAVQGIVSGGGGRGGRGGGGEKLVSDNHPRGGHTPGQKR